MSELITTQDVQDLLKVDRTTIYRMIESGQLPAIRVGKQWRFRQPEIARWLTSHSAVAGEDAPHPLAEDAPQPQPVPPVGSGRALSLRELLPMTAAQHIQDGFADALGVTIVTTDMNGGPVTEISNACGYHLALMRNEDALDKCAVVWRQLAASPSIEPRFYPNEMGLLCARGLIRVGSALEGMVIVGGIAPEPWPPQREKLSDIADLFGLEPQYVEGKTDAVFRLEANAQQRALRAAQRVADIFAHLAEERAAHARRLRQIASLTQL
ncbi:MAG: PocR ligand-binding domain-containing protein [Thermoflexales bacterium]|nr:PocR ligand-binding domain-containing protein [Thermoflexales bacterium]